MVTRFIVAVSLLTRTAALRFVDVALVAVGGGLGSVLRWGIGQFVAKRYHGSIPVSTIIINISGAFIIAYLSVLFSVDWHDRYGSTLNAAVLTGFLGGYTTFSTMQYDAAKLSASGRGDRAALYLISSLAMGLAAAALGAGLAYWQG